MSAAIPTGLILLWFYWETMASHPCPASHGPRDGCHHHPFLHPLHLFIVLYKALEQSSHLILSIAPWIMEDKHYDPPFTKKPRQTEKSNDVYEVTDPVNGIWVQVFLGNISLSGVGVGQGDDCNRIAMWENFLNNFRMTIQGNSLKMGACSLQLTLSLSTSSLQKWLKLWDICWIEGTMLGPRAGA